MYKVVVVKGMVDNGVHTYENVKELQKLLNAGWLIHHSIARDSCLIVLKQGKES